MYLCRVLIKYDMAKINFYIRSKQTGQPATVFLRYNIGRKVDKEGNLKYNDGRQTDIWTQTPEKIFPEYWSNVTQSFKQRIHYNKIFTQKDKAKIETRFNELKEFVVKEVMNLTGRPVTREWLSTTINKYYNVQTSAVENLNQYISRFIVEAETGIRLSKGNRYAFSTIKNYKGFQTQFNEYQGIYTEEREKELKEKDEKPRPLKRLNFDDITIDFYNSFLAFFNEKRYSPNTIGRHIKHLKVLMRQAKDEGLHNNSEFQRKSFEAMAVKVENIYLTETELKELFDLDLSGNKVLDISRDVFLCGCYTAQRYSDYSRINKSNIRIIDGKKVIDLIQQKTSERVVIPIRTELETILKKYDYTLPKTHEQKINEKIKDIGAEAKITEVVQYEENRGGLRVKLKAHKNERIKTHTARRSGCTNMYLAGIPILSIMKISGHKTEREFLKYIKITKDETAVNLSSHPYFIGNTLSIAR
jgi:hypothetical protein